MTIQELEETVDLRRRGLLVRLIQRPSRAVNLENLATHARKVRERDALRVSEAVFGQVTSDPPFGEHSREV